jgi:acylpyruvate hydrolase
MRIFCIGRNYAAHAAELNNATPDEPVVFIKPISCLVEIGCIIPFPLHGKDLHHEAEVVVRIDRPGKNISLEDAPLYISHLAVGLDLTLRDVQNELKEKRLPWEKAKAFDGSSPLGVLVKFAGQDLTDIQIGCEVNGELRQNGTTASMLFPIKQIISHISSIWTLREGDLIYTGTPSGVGPLHKGDEITVFSAQLGRYSWKIS